MLDKWLIILYNKGFKISLIGNVIFTQSGFNMKTANLLKKQKNNEILMSFSVY